MYKVKEPIELTPEVLEKSGFEFKNGIWTYETDTDDVRIRLENDYKMVTIKTPWACLTYETSGWSSIGDYDIKNLLDVCTGSIIEFKK